MNRRNILLGITFATLTAAGSAHAANCDGFTDVQDTDSYCNSVQWLKNRAITLGCDVAQYCPSASVTRASMALFMNRLGTALTPTFQYVEGIPGAIDIQASPDNYVCQTSDFPVTGFPRTAIVHGRFWGALDAAGTWFMDHWYSTDGGATWSYLNTFIPHTSTSQAGATQQTGYGVLNLDVGSTYRFAMRIRNYIGTAKFTTGYCNQLLEIISRDAGSPPFDHQPAPHAASFDHN